MNETLHFAQPAWIVAGVVISLLTGLFLQLRAKKQQDALQRFASGRLLSQLVVNVSSSKRLWKTMLVCLATLLTFVALARPQYGSTWLEVRSRGIDLLFALDTSKSMLTQDIRPSRLQRARLAILDFLEKMHGDRVGLLPFAGSSYLMCPLTLDYNAFAETLAEVNTEIIPRGGTNIAGVIEDAEKILDGSTNHKILILLTDGENLQGDALQAATQAAQKGLSIYTIGVGTPAGELVPDSGHKGFIKDKTGRFITSKLDETTLRGIAEKSGGLYVPLGVSDEGLQTIYKKQLQHLTKDEREERKKQVPIERFNWPLGCALALFLLELLISETKRKPLQWQKLFHGKLRSRASSASIVLLFLITAIPSIAYCSYGEKAFAQQEYLQASEYYSKQLKKHPDDPRLNYNYGTAAYKNNMFDDAIQAFQKALKAGDVGLQKDSYYNLGNSYYQKGEGTRKAAPDKTRTSWQQALTSFDAALKLDPRDTSAQHNRKLVAKKLKELKRQLGKKKKQNPGQNTGNKDTKKSNKDQNSSGTPGNTGKQSSSSKSGQKDKTAPSPAGQQKTKSPQQTDGQNADQPQAKPRPTSEQKPQAQPVQPAKAKAGMLSKKEAEQLLNSLKAEEGVLNFLPGAPHDDETIERDW